MSLAYYYIPTGGVEKQVDPSQINNGLFNDDIKLQVQTIELAKGAGIEASCWPYDKGVLLQGTAYQARAFSMIGDENPSMTAQKTQVATVKADNDNDVGLKGFFANAAKRFQVENISSKFGQAANDISGPAPVQASKPSVRGTTMVSAPSLAA